jgi:hypothetical protein
MEKTVVQSDVNHLVSSLIAANEHKLREAQQIGFGSFYIFTNAVKEEISKQCSIT